MKPSELLFAESHEWVHVSEENGQKIATIGISAFAIQQLNDLVYMDLPEVGKTLEVGDEFGEVESVKAVSPLYSPVAGEITEVHSELPDNLESLGEDPYGEGWIVKVRLSDESSLSSLMDFATYEKQIAAEG
ncbi:glycine cleavage system protein GcvH [Planctomycetaceae bacterium SH139]